MGTIPRRTVAVVLSAILAGSSGGVAWSVPTPESWLLPPFVGGGPTEASSIMLPCREVPRPGGNVPASDPSTGTFSVSVSAKAEECRSLGYSAEETWTLGPAPAALVGASANLRVTFVPMSWGSTGEGTPARFGAQVWMDIAGSSPWTLMGFVCEPTTCSREPVTDPVAFEPWVFEVTVAAMPAEIETHFRAEAYVADGTGEASMHLTGRLVSVLVTPAGAVPGPTP